MSQELNTIHTFVSGCSAGHLELRLAKKIHTFALGCSRQEQLGAARSSQEQPGAARVRQE